MPLQSRLTSPAREARTTEEPTQAAAPVVEPTTSPRRRTYDKPIEAEAPVQQEAVVVDAPESVTAQDAPETTPEPENPAPTKRRGPKPGTKRATRRIALPVTGSGETLDIGAAKQRQKEIEGQAASLLQQYQKDLAELESEHRELAIQISAATFGH